MIATSLTRPMLTARKVFSSSLTISALSVDDTGTIVSMKLAVHRLRHLQAPRRDAAQHLGGVVGEELGVPGIDPLRREGQEEVLVGLAAGLHEPGEQHLAGEAGEGGALEDDQLRPLHPGREHLRRVHDERVVRVLGLVERRGHADDDDVRRREHVRVGRGVERAGRDQRRQRLGRDVVHVRDAPAQRPHLVDRLVIGGDLEAGLGHLDGQRKTDIARRRSPPPSPRGRQSVQAASSSGFQLHSPGALFNASAGRKMKAFIRHIGRHPTNRPGRPIGRLPSHSREAYLHQRRVALCGQGAVRPRGVGSLPISLG